LQQPHLRQSEKRVLFRRGLCTGRATDPSGLAERHSSNKQEANREKHQDSRNPREEAEAKARRQVSEADSHLQTNVENDIRRAREQLQEQAKTAERNLLRTGDAAERTKLKNLREAIAELNKLEVGPGGVVKNFDAVHDVAEEALVKHASWRIKTIDALGKAADKFPLKKIKVPIGALTKVGTRAVPAVGAVVTIYQWEQRRSEAGVVRATVEAVPVLGDVVQITSNVVEIRRLAAETTAIYDGININQHVQNRQTFCRHEAVDKYNEIANGIRVKRPEYINIEKISAALQQYYMDLDWAYNRGIAGADYPIIKQGLRDAETRFREGIIDAVGKDNIATPDNNEPSNVPLL